MMDDYTIEKLEEDEYVLGTEVYFEIAIGSRKSLAELFREFSFDGKSTTLDTTVIPVELYQEGEVWISRSQAKKVLAGLDKFKKIVFDFKGIKMIGQGFADEIFRVFSIHHPEIELEAINMSESVKLMVRHAQNDTTGR
ncbi:STAS-like domain-containing protein [Candidatus Saccharibacteria bacterium]|nr:STAS-like domain-containing protein [Candidatus Saccharibacteria bacterium]